MKLIDIEIRGIQPLLMHRFTEEAETASSSKARSVKVDRGTPREQAEKAANKHPDGTFYISAFAIPNAMGAAGANYKMPGTRKSMRFIVPSAIRIFDPTITVMNGSGPATDFEVDSRPVTIPSTKGRIMRHRPRFDCWGLQFSIGVDDNLMEVSDAQMLLEQAGLSIGLGDFRPEKRGPFGTFRVTKFEERKE